MSSRTPKGFKSKKAASPWSARLFATSFEIADTLNNSYPGLNIATRTVRENLWKLGYQVCVPKKIPFLTSIAKERRVSW
ncbi:18597_t:CDS:1, partial [Funneliformis geosporum]